MVDMVAKAKALILGLLASAATTAATVDLTLPPGDYYLVPVQPYTVVTIQSTPVDPPVIDTDGDGVNDDIDQCNDTPAGDEVDATGCTVVPPPVDTDGDGMPDDADACPTEPAQTADGCPIYPPSAGGDILSAIAAMAPAQHPTEARFFKIPGSEIDVLVRCDEFDYGDDILCHKSHNAFMDWTGGAWQWKDFEFVLPAGGGHADYWGNEVYRANLIVADGQLAIDWSRPIDPSPMVDPACKNNPASGPLSSHTYASPVYIDSRDEYVHGTTFGNVFDEPCMTYINAGKGLWATDGEGWRRVVDGTHYSTEYGRACYLRNRDKLYYFTGGGSRKHLIDPADDYALTTQYQMRYVSNSGFFDTAADQNNEICYEYTKGEHIKGYSDGWTSEVWRSNSATLSVPSLSVEHSTGNLVIVGGEGYAMHIDVVTGEELNISATDGSGIPIPNSTASYLYGKFDMIEPLPCVGIGVGDAREGVYLMTLPANVCTKEASLPPVATLPDPPQDTAEFVEQCIASGAVFCDPLSTHGPYKVEDGALILLPNPDGSEGIYHGSWWRNWRGKQEWPGATADYDSDQDALRLTRTDTSISSGLFVTNFSDDLSVQYSEGDSFWIQFQFRYNCDYVYIDCDPSSTTYKTDRRPFINGSATQGSKIAILAEGDITLGHDGDPAGACERIQIVPYQMFGEVRAFHDCGKYQGITALTGKGIGGSVQIDYQPGGDHRCLRFPDDENRIGESWAQGGTGPECAMIEADEWMTLRMQVDVVEWGAPVNRFQMWFAHEGQPLKKVIDQNILIRDPGEYYGYGKIWFQMHSTGADTDLGEPDRVVWYRNLMVGNAI